MQTAYRTSPFFEYYEDEFHPFYHKKKYEKLIDFNISLNLKLIELLDIETKIEMASTYQEDVSKEMDFRNSFSPKKETLLKFTPYIQVFGERNGFTPNLSILDILFNEGPNSVNYIKGLKY